MLVIEGGRSDGLTLVAGGGRDWRVEILIGVQPSVKGVWEGVDDACGLDGGVGDAFDHEADGRVTE